MRRRKKRTNVNLLYVIIILFLIFIATFLKSLTFKQVIISPLSGKNNADIIGNKKISYLFSKKALANNIFYSNPEIIKITFSQNYFSSILKINLEFEKIVARICSDECFFFGEHGYIFKSQISNLEKANLINSPSPRNLNSVSISGKTQNLFVIVSNLKIYDNSVLEYKISSSLEKIFEISNLKSIPLSMTEILLNKDLKITIKNGWYILIDPNQDTDKQIKKLEFFLSNKKEYIEKLQYIDLRIPQKIFYK